MAEPLRSRTTVPTETPYEWRTYVDDTHPSSITFAAWLSSLSPFNLRHFVGQLDGLKEAAANGLIPHGQPDDTTRIKPIWDQPELWELRWTMLTTKVRQYHAEPISEPNLLAALHIHVKDVTGTRAQSKAAQDAEIKEAVKSHTNHGNGGWA